MYGCFLPKVHSLYIKCKSIVEDVRPSFSMKTAVICLVNGIIESLETRFGSHLPIDLNDAAVRLAYLAAVTHLQYKLDWLRSDWSEEYRSKKETEIREIFIHEIELLKQQDHGEGDESTRRKLKQAAVTEVDFHHFCSISAIPTSHNYTNIHFFSNYRLLYILTKMWWQIPA